LVARYIAETKRASGRWLTLLAGVGTISADDGRYRIQIALLGGLGYFAAQHLPPVPGPTELTPEQLQVLADLVAFRLGDISVLDYETARQLAATVLAEASRCLQTTQPTELELPCGTATVTASGTWVIHRQR
jgi:hypothetical protein